MSVFDPIKNLFASKPQELEKDASRSLPMPYQDAGLEPSDTVLAAHAVDAACPAPLHAAPRSGAPQDPAWVAVPALATRPARAHLRILGVVLGLSLLLLAGVTVYALGQSDRVAQQLGVTAQSLVQSQRLAQSATQALRGQARAFADVAESAEALAQAAQFLREGDRALLDRAGNNAKRVMQQQKTLTQTGAALRQIGRQSTALLEIAQNLAYLKVQQGASAAEMAAMGQLLMLTQRMGKLSNAFLIDDGAKPETLLLLGKDLDSFKELSQGLLAGNAELHLSAAKDAATRQQAELLISQFEDMRAQGSAMLATVQGLATARDAQAGILADSEALRRSLQAVQGRQLEQTGVGGWTLVLLFLAAALALLSGSGLAYVQLQDSRRRQSLADTQRLEAQRQEQGAKRVNDANQAAILRLMNELQTVAEGDLTQEATVTEDITGAIADSVNYTVEELRSLVGHVQNTASRVAQTTADVDATSTELLAASREQLHEIRETGQNVLEMAGRINNVSLQAQESARVARQSLLVAETGFKAVQNTIGGMNAIRDQIQDTSKRIKRLGESSQEIGEITELISDITGQTNVLALNAAIQAASAGEAGRGFSVVAEEVQRLAERSADATRQIAALVKAIQADTQDAMGAMERSTQGVVEGAKLSDNAGAALTEIERVSRRVADLIEQISNAASREAGMANDMAESIQHIFAVTEQTGEGTRVTAAQVRELSGMADELRQSVSRFKIV